MHIKMMQVCTLLVNVLLLERPNSIKVRACSINNNRSEGVTPVCAHREYMRAALPKFSL